METPIPPIYIVDDTPLSQGLLTTSTDDTPLSSARQNSESVISNGGEQGEDNKLPSPAFLITPMDDAPPSLAVQNAEPGISNDRERGEEQDLANMREQAQLNEQKRTENDRHWDRKEAEAKAVLGKAKQDARAVSEPVNAKPPGPIRQMLNERKKAQQQERERAPALDNGIRRGR